MSKKDYITWSEAKNLIFIIGIITFLMSIFFSMFMMHSLFTIPNKLIPEGYEWEEVCIEETNCHIFLGDKEGMFIGIIEIAEGQRIFSSSSECESEIESFKDLSISLESKKNNYTIDTKTYCHCECLKYEKRLIKYE